LSSPYTSEAAQAGVKNLCAILFEHMNRFLKTLLIWLLMAVVPLNAVAAAVGMSCGPGHQQAMERLASHDPGHAMHEGTGQHHDMPDASGPAHDAAMPADTASSDTGQSAHSSCSACSVFCVGAVAPPSVFVSIPLFIGSEGVLVSPAPAATGFIPERLRRPPRQISA
jgi:hypothetical protein